MLRRDVFLGTVEHGELQIPVPDKDKLKPRHKGDVVGDHFHLGVDATKRPEIIHIISGEWRVEFGRVVGTTVTGACSMGVETQPCTYHVGPHTWHRLTLLSEHGFIIVVGEDPTRDTLKVDGAPPRPKVGR